MKQIYKKNKVIIDLATSITDYCKVQNYYKATELLIELVSHINESAESILINIDFYNQNGVIMTEESFLTTLKELLEAQESENYIKVADILELQLIPLMSSMQDILKLTGEDFYSEHDYFSKNVEHLRAAKADGVQEAIELLNEEYLIDRTIENNIEPELYKLESAINGSLTLKKSKKDIYIHSINNPERDAKLFAKEYMKDCYDTYIVWGIGLGYHIKALLDMEALNVIVIEPDINMIYLALTNIDFPELSDGRLRIIHDANYTKVANYLGDEKKSKLLIHEPSLHAEKELVNMVKDDKIMSVLERLEQVFIRISSINNNMPLMISNFKSNIKNCKGYVDELEKSFKGKKVIIVAGGPSLDKNVHLLRNIKTVTENNKNEYVILAVGTVFKKLLSLDIRPDYIIVADANYVLFNQIDGMCDNDIPLLILSTACKTFAKKYKGKTYLIDQNEFDLSEEHAHSYHYKTYDTGGSVTTTATSVAVKLNAKEVIFIGLDLAYTNGITHAQGTMDRKNVDTKGMIKISDVFGGTVYTTNIFNIYRTWLENYVKKYEKVHFIDATEGGAKIYGMDVMTLKEVLRG